MIMALSESDAIVARKIRMSPVPNPIPNEEYPCHISLSMSFVTKLASYQGRIQDFRKGGRSRETVKY